MKIRVTNIDWDWDEDDGPRPEELPSEVIIDDPLLIPSLADDIEGNAENLAEWLTNEYGYCLRGFYASLEGVTGI